MKTNLHVFTISPQRRVTDIQNSPYWKTDMAYLQSALEKTPASILIHL